MFGEIQFVQWAMQHLGVLGAVMVLGLLLSLRFLPSVLQELRERRLAKLQARQGVAQREAELLRRLEAKDAKLETILTNHIAHLQAETADTRSFHQAATEHLKALTHELRELRVDLSKVADHVDEVRGNVREIKGRAS